MVDKLIKIKNDQWGTLLMGKGPKFVQRLIKQKFYSSVEINTTINQIICV